MNNTGRHIPKLAIPISNSNVDYGGISVPYK